MLSGRYPTWQNARLKTIASIVFCIVALVLVYEERAVLDPRKANVVSVLPSIPSFIWHVFLHKREIVSFTRDSDQRLEITLYCWLIFPNLQANDHIRIQNFKQQFIPGPSSIQNMSIISSTRSAQLISSLTFTKHVRMSSTLSRALSQP